LRGHEVARSMPGVRGTAGGPGGGLSAADPAAAGVEFSAGGLALLPPFVPLHGLARWSTRLLVATGGLAALSLGVEISQLRLLLQPIEGEAARQLARTAQAATGGVLGMLRVALLVATATAFLVWLYHARANVRALGVRRPRFNRGWVVGAFLVPGLNLVRPPAVVAEIWQASDPAILDPFGWRGARVPPLVRIWWVAFLAWAVLAGLALFTDLTAGVVLGRLRLAAALSAASDASACAATAFAWLLVTRLGDAQQAKWERLQASRGEGG
jgi:hypothetical protein